MRTSLLLTVVCLVVTYFVQAQGNQHVWNMNGNSNATLVNKFGTTNNVSLRFVTNNMERLKISNTGNIGIGTSTPTEKLHVNGNGVFTGSLGVGTTTPKEKLHVVGNTLINGYTKILSNGELGMQVIADYSTGDPVSDYDVHWEVGIMGQADYGGVAGYATYRNGRGIFGNGETGVWGDGLEYGVVGKGNYGIYGSSQDGFAGYFDGPIYSTMEFTASDRNLKKDISEVDDALSLVGKLSPKYYSFRNDGKLAKLNLPKGKHYGLIAQELEAVMPDLVRTTKHKLPSEKPESKPEEITIKSINYTELVPVLVKSVQELDAENKLLKEELADLRQIVMDLKNNNSSSITAIKGYLEASTPNPARNSTLVRYEIPQNSVNAHLVLTNMKGQILKQVTLTSKGTGQLTLNTAELASGTYTYTLYVDGKVSDSKKLVVTR